MATVQTKAINIDEIALSSTTVKTGAAVYITVFYNGELSEELIVYVANNINRSYGVDGLSLNVSFTKEE